MPASGAVASHPVPSGARVASSTGKTAAADSAAVAAAVAVVEVAAGELDLAATAVAAVDTRGSQNQTPPEAYHRAFVALLASLLLYGLARLAEMVDFWPEMENLYS